MKDMGTNTTEVAGLFPNHVQVCTCQQAMRRFLLGVLRSRAADTPVGEVDSSQEGRACPVCLTSKSETQGQCKPLCVQTTLGGPRSAKERQRPETLAETIAAGR